MNEIDFDRTRPRYDEAFDDWVDGLIADDDGRLLEQLRDRFRRGALDECCRSVNFWLTGEMERLSQGEVAKWLGVNQSTVSRWLAGRTITLEHLVSLLIEFHGEFDQINLPIRETLVVKGYAAVMQFIREKLGHPKPPRPTDETVWILCSLFSRSDWVDARKRNNPDRLEAAGKRVLHDVRVALGREPQHVASTDDLKWVVKEWGGAWVICLYIVDYLYQARTWAIRGAKT
jgi:hypothetical protein